MKKESLAIRFLYGTAPGRACLKIFTQPAVSKLSARFFSSGISRFIIPFFIKKNGIDMDRYLVPAGGYGSFNEFFTRRAKEGENCPEDAGLISPCDGLLSIKLIENDTIIEAKNSRYRVAELLRDRKLAAKYSEGMALIFRLTPSHYHRFCYCTEGTITKQRRIDGILHCVRPLAVRTQKVYTQNSREYTLIQTRDSGLITQMEVGAMLVGKISNSPLCKPLNKVRAGEEKGCFEYGGSTIILLLEHKIRLNPVIMGRKAVDGEIPVTIGEALV